MFLIIHIVTTGSLNVEINFLKICNKNSSNNQYISDMDREVKKNVADFAKFRAYLKKKTKKNSCLQSEFLILIKEIVWVLFENIDFHA